MIDRHTEIPKISDNDIATPAAGEKELEALFDQLGSIDTGLDVAQQSLLEALKKGRIAATDENLDFAFRFMIAMVGTEVIKWNATTFKAELNEEKYKKLAVPFSEKNKRILKEHIQAYVSNLPDAWEFFPSAESPDAYFETNYPGLSKNEAIKKLLADYRQEYEHFGQLFIGKLLSRIVDGNIAFPSELVAEVESGKDITSVTLKELIAAKNSLATLKIMFSYSPADAAEKPDYNDMRSRMSSPQAIAKAIERVKGNIAGKKGKGWTGR